MTIAYTPAYTIYYTVNLNTLINKINREFDYYSWDKYSWFLYGRGLQSEALNANEKAVNAINNSLERYISFDSVQYSDAKHYLEIVKHHKELITNKTWNNYHD